MSEGGIVVPIGYRQTEIGLLPEDWDYSTLGNLFDITSSKRVFQSEWRSSGVPFYRAREIAVLSEKNRVSNELFISYQMYETYTREYGAIKTGDVLITGVGTLGKVYVVNENDKFYFKDGNIIWLRSKELVNSKFLKQLYYTPLLIAQVFGTSSGTTVGTYTINNAKKTLIPLPPLPEQHAIAEILFNVDIMVESLEKLIVKKKAIKQGTMQELLTGKRRLPKYDGGWERKPLSQILTIVHGQGQRDIQVESGEYPILGSSGEIGRTNRFLYNKPSVLIGRKGTIDKPQYMESPFWTIDTLFYTIIADEYSAKYLYYLFCMIDWNKHNEASGVPSLSSKTVGAIEIMIPPLKEQTAIASVFSDMDGEIEALSAKLEKTKLIKQGMMQELLTGRKRIWKPEEKITPFPVAKSQKTTPQSGHNPNFDDAVMIAGIVNVFYNPKYPLGRKKVQKLLYLLRRHQDRSTAVFKKKAAGPYADEVRYKGGEPIAKKNQYITVTTVKDKGTTFVTGKNIEKALEYIRNWDKQDDIQWLVDKFLYTGVEKLELLATVDMAMCDLKEARTPVSLASIKHLIATNNEWKAKLQKTIFSDEMIKKAIVDLEKLF